MFQSIDELQKVSKDNIDVASKSFAVVTKGVQTLAAEAVDYSKKSLEASTAATEKLLGAKSLDKAIEVQTDFLKSAYEGFVAQSTKVGELFVNIAKDAYKPYEGIIAKATATK